MVLSTVDEWGLFDLLWAGDCFGKSTQSHMRVKHVSEGLKDLLSPLIPTQTLTLCTDPQFVIWEFVELFVMKSTKYLERPHPVNILSLDVKYCVAAIAVGGSCE